MQTIYLDISNKGVVPTIYAKQGDVGRKFLAVINDAGVPYSLSGAAISVWYSGTSGEGNYTDIGADSAVSVSGNEITVELITQMLANYGEGRLCMAINTTDGDQLGTWNIQYMVEPLPGMGSAAAQQYFTAFSQAVQNLPYPDTSLSLVGKAAEAAAVGAALAGKAPAGYGLGDSDHNIPANGAITVKFNPNRHAALISVQGATMNNRAVFVVNTYGSGGVRTHIERLSGTEEVLYGILPESADNTNGIVLFNQTADPYVSASILVLQGEYPDVTNGNSGVTAEPFEWDNPPMIPSVEYRTTERWNGEAVYTMAINFGALPNNDIKTVQNIVNADAEEIRIDGWLTDTDGYNHPLWTFVMYANAAANHTSKGYVTLETNANYSYLNATLILKYVVRK